MVYHNLRIIQFWKDDKHIPVESYNLNIMASELSATKVIGILTSTIPFGVEYDVYVTKNGVRISNKAKHLLKIFIEGDHRLCQDFLNLFCHPPP